MRDVIAFILGNFTLTFFVAGLLASAIALWRARPPRSSALIVEALFSYFVLFSIGFSNLYNFVLHVFFGKLAASFIYSDILVPIVGFIFLWLQHRAASSRQVR